MGALTGRGETTVDTCSLSMIGSRYRPTLRGQTEGKDMNTTRQYAMGRRDQTDAVAKCEPCRHTYYRHSAKTWLEPNPWRSRMPDHTTVCGCGRALTYQEVQP